MNGNPFERLDSWYTKSSLLTYQHCWGWLRGTINDPIVIYLDDDSRMPRASFRKVNQRFVHDGVDSTTLVLRFEYSWTSVTYQDHFDGSLPSAVNVWGNVGIRSPMFTMSFPTPFIHVPYFCLPEFVHEFAIAMIHPAQWSVDMAL